MDELTDAEYIAELEKMVRENLTDQGFEWFYWDVLPQSSYKAKLAYARATGDKRFLEECGVCGAAARWIRATQFAGTHRFCEEHAKEEENFGQEDPSYFFWEEIED